MMIGTTIITTIIITMTGMITITIMMMGTTTTTIMTMGTTITTITEVDPGFGTGGLIGKRAVLLLNGAEDDEENETDD